MKISYSTRWLVSWVLFILAVLALVAGVFAFAADWRRGLGLCLVGSGIAAPTLWWLRHTTRSSRVPRVKTNAVLGILMLSGGLVVFPWDSFSSNLENDEDGREPQETNSAAVQPSTTSEATLQGTSTSAEPEETGRTTAEAPSGVVETVVTTQPPETVTEIETLVPPSVTVYREVPPQEPAPQSTYLPTVPSQEPPTNSGVPETSTTVTPELTEPTEPQEETEPIGENEGQIQEETLGDGNRGMPRPPQQDTSGQPTPRPSEDI